MHQVEKKTETRKSLGQSYLDELFYFGESPEAAENAFFTSDFKYIGNAFALPHAIAILYTCMMRSNHHL